MTPRIQLLTPDIVGKIAAGEVVERPGSVVKELLENALDAGATAVDLDVVEGGRDLIRITDNGLGIPRDDLPLALTAHATSKIRSADDLFRVETMGFRGEALASIASVSDLRLQSRPADQEIGARIESLQGHLSPVVECGCPVGTQIEVRQLFASVPVRRKFLKTKQTELGHISDALTRLALAREGIDLKLRHNDRVIYHRPADFDRQATIDLFFGQEVAQALIPVSSAGGGISVTGFVVDPKVHRPNNRHQFFFVNGRFIRDRSLGHALQEAYRGLLLTGRYPLAFLFIEMPCDEVDVNVHPTKIEVRFEEPRRLYSQVLATVRERFLRADLSARLQPSRESTSPAADFFREKSVINDTFSLDAFQPQPSLWATPKTEDPSAADVDRVSFDFPPAAHDPPRWMDEPKPRAPLPPTFSSSSRSIDDATTLPVGGEIPTTHASPSGLQETVRAIQLHHAYLVVETNDGMLLVDQHALHERILYEQLRHRVATGSWEVQELLVPEPVDLTPLQAALLIEQRDVLADTGLVIEEFGDRSVLLRGYPAMLRRLRPAELLRSIADRLEETGKPPSRDELLEEVLHMTACKAAVKAGDPLTPEEIDALVRQRHLVDDSHHCPHGRPTILRFTLNDLERQFLRK